MVSFLHNEIYFNRHIQYLIKNLWPNHYGSARDTIVLLNNLKQVRQSKKISQKELAKMVGTTRQTIIYIEKNQFNPSANWHCYYALR